MTANERELLVRTSVALAHVLANDSVETEVLKAFTIALHNMEREMVANNERGSLLKPVLDETKQ